MNIDAVIHNVKQYPVVADTETVSVFSGQTFDIPLRRVQL